MLPTRASLPATPRWRSVSVSSPLAQERYDLVVARDDLADPRLVRLFEVMTSAPFRRELVTLGYDVGQCGQRVAEILAA